jgi:hypothetical protein
MDVKLLLLFMLCGYAAVRKAFIPRPCTSMYKGGCNGGKKNLIILLPFINYCVKIEIEDMEQRKRRITHGKCFAAFRRLGVRSARSWLCHSHASLTHIWAARKPTVCFLVPPKRQFTYARYAQVCLKFLQK